MLLNVKNSTWPDRRADSELEEGERKQREEAERRLFYVVFTRAKKKIVMLLGNSQDEDSSYIDELELPEQAVAECLSASREVLHRIRRHGDFQTTPRPLGRP